MKNLFKVISFLTVAGFMLASCEGPMGPAGANGQDGQDGTDGIDANATCTQCHKNDQVITGKVAQWEASVHATGGNSERNGTDCAPCHTSQGFLEANAAGQFARANQNPSTAGVIADPNQQNCYTCHQIHKTYTSDDWAFTKTAATVAFHTTDGTSSVSVDLGKGNMCTGCHQGRALEKVLDMTNNTDTYVASSYRWGIHHGPQYNIITGKGLYEFAGSVEYPTAENHITEQTTDACVTCHMNTAYGTQAGGHTMNVAYDYHGNTINNLPKSCEVCHVPKGVMDLSVKKDALQADVVALLEELGTALETAGVKSPGEDYIVHIPAIAPQTDMMLAAFTNFQALTEDRSEGMHNPAYARAILQNTIEAVMAAK